MKTSLLASHLRLHAWVERVAALCLPENIHLCDGSIEEAEMLSELLVKKGTFVPLKRPFSFWCHSTSSDVARLEEATFICSSSQEKAGPTNHWRDPREMRALLEKKFSGSMKGRTLYVIPFCMGPLHSPFCKFGVQFTDSPYVVCNMRIMTRMGKEVFEALSTEPFLPCVHSMGFPLSSGVEDVPWPENKEKYIVHFPEENEVWSYGSGYGGNALCGKKSMALRLASVWGREEGWLAEHMLILGLTSPEGKKHYIAAAFPSSCGKTNLALLNPSLPGWKVECVGDDIAWIHPGADGRLWAINPENGFFAVAPGTSVKSNQSMMQASEKNTIFTNVALKDGNDVWWEGLSADLPEHLIDWQGKDWTPGCKRLAAHPNGRLTAPLNQCPVLDPAFDSAQGVPLSAIIFGGRRADTMPLVYETTSWNRGVLAGASLSSESTAAAKGIVGKVRHDPFAMLPFCGYNMGEYFSHWIEMGERLQAPPKIFCVNWFAKDETGKFLWPGFGENIRVLKWICDRLEQKVEGKKTPIGLLPYASDLDLTGLNVDIEKLIHIDPFLWKKEIDDLTRYFALFGKEFPSKLAQELSLIREEFI